MVTEITQWHEGFLDRKCVAYQPVEVISGVGRR